MATKFEEQLAQIKAEIERQDAEWERAKRELGALGDVQLYAPEGSLQEITEACAPRTTHAPTGHGIRA